MSWQRVSLVVGGREAELLAESLEAAGALATEIADADAGTEEEEAVFGEPGADTTLWRRCRVSALLHRDADAGAIVDAALHESGVQALGEASLNRIEAIDWVRETQRQFEPIRVGERIWVVPTWHSPPDPAALNIILDPGAAFGTGSHPTTRLVLQWLEREVRAGDTVLDYGCGSGILAIAAMKLGAARAAGVDVDPLALEAAGYNASQNGVELTLAHAGTGLDFAARLTVANILANPLRMLAPLLAAHTAPGGSMALSGILESQADEVARAYAPFARLAVAGREGGWVLLAGPRHAAC